MKLPMVLLWKAVVLDMGVQGLQAHPQKFWFAENLGKSPESPGENGAQRCLTSKMAPKAYIKTHEDLFLVVTPKRGLHDLCGRKFVGKSCTKNFSGKFVEIREKSFAPQKFSCSYTMMKRHLCPVLPLLKGQRDNCPRHASILRRP